MRNTVRLPMRSASGPARKMDRVADRVCEDTVHPSSKSVSAKWSLTNTTAPVNSEPSKPSSSPLRAMIRIVPMERGAPKLLPRRGHRVALDQLRFEQLLDVLLLLVDVFEHPARGHGAHVGDRVVDRGELRVDV